MEEYNSEDYFPRFITNKLTLGEQEHAGYLVAQEFGELVVMPSSVIYVEYQSKIEMD